MKKTILLSVIVMLSGCDITTGNAKLTSFRPMECTHLNSGYKFKITKPENVKYSSGTLHLTNELDNKTVYPTKDAEKDWVCDYLGEEVIL